MLESRTKSFVKFSDVCNEMGWDYKSFRQEQSVLFNKSVSHSLIAKGNFAFAFVRLSEENRFNIVMGGIYYIDMEN